MARTERQFRIRVSTRGADTMSGNVDLTFLDADIVDLPQTWGGQEVSPLEGRVRTQGWSVKIHDKGDQVTSNLSADFSSFSDTRRADILARLIDISVSDDGGSTWSVEATGEIDSVRSQRDNPAVYEFDVLDELTKLKEETIYEETKKIGSGNNPEATTSLYPGGIWEGHGTAEGVDPIRWFVEEVSGSRVTLIRVITEGSLGLTSGAVGRRTNIPEPNRRAISEDLKATVEDFDPGSVPDTGEGHFENLRFWVEEINESTGTAGAQQNYELYAQKSLITKDGRVGKKVKYEGTESRAVTRISLKWGSNQPSASVPFTNSDTVSGIIYLPNVEPTDRVPLHIGGQATVPSVGFKPENGLHPVDYAREIFDRAGADYDSTQLDTKKKQRADLPKLWPRITSPVNAWDELREKVFKPYGLVPVVQKDGDLAIKEHLMPTEDQVSDVTTLTTFDATTLAGPTAPDIRIAGEHQVTRVTTQLLRWQVNLAEPSRQWDWTQNPSGPDAADMLRLSEDSEKQYERHISEFGVHEINLDYTYLEFIGQVSENGRAHIGKQVAEAYLDRYSQGGVWTEVTGMEAIRDEGVGDYVVVDVSTYPNLRDQTRGGTRLMQIIKRDFREVGADIQLLDAGPDKQPLPAPSISVSSTTQFSIDVAVGGSGGTGTALEGGRVVLEVAQDSTEPAIDSDKWTPAGEIQTQGTVTITCLAPDTKYFIRGRQFAEDRIASAWTSAISTTTSKRTSPSSLTVAEDLGCAVRISWTNGDSALPTQILVDDVPRTPPAQPGASEHFIRNLDPSTSYTFKVRHVSRCGGHSGSASLSHTTGTADTGPRMGLMTILIGDEV